MNNKKAISEIVLQPDFLAAGREGGYRGIGSGAGGWGGIGDRGIGGRGGDFSQKLTG